MFLIPVITICMTVAASTAQRILLPVFRDSHGGNHSSDVVGASNSLGFALLQQIPATGNAFFSPLSISMAMGMLYLGAKNKTAAELQRVLRFESYRLGPEQVQHGHKQVMDVLKQAGRKNDNEGQYSFEMANAVLVDKSYDIVTSFKEKARYFYEAAAESVSFATHPEAAVESINGWAAWKTRNKIANILQEPLDQLTKLFLLNAVYFKGTWKTRFDQRLTMPDTFYNDGRIPKTVPMMRQKKKFSYGFVNQIKSHALELPYEGDHIRMLILLPQKRDGLQNLETSLTRDLVESVPSSLRLVTVQVTLPRFTLEEEYDMISLFKAMGLNAVFDADKADLTGISPRKGLYITKILHKSVVDVNEEGSEAASVTAVAAGVRTGGPLHPLFTADHPFIFFIMDNRTNALMFVGRVNVL